MTPEELKIAATFPINLLSVLIWIWGVFSLVLLPRVPKKICVSQPTTGYEPTHFPSVAADWHLGSQRHQYSRGLLSGYHLLAVCWSISYKSQMVVGFCEGFSACEAVLLSPEEESWLSKSSFGLFSYLFPTQQILQFLSHQSVFAWMTDFSWETKILLILLITLLGTRGWGGN